MNPKNKFIIAINNWFGPHAGYRRRSPGLILSHLIFVIPAPQYLYSKNG